MSAALHKIMVEHLLRKSAITPRLSNMAPSTKFRSTGAPPVVGDHHLNLPKGYDVRVSGYVLPHDDFVEVYFTYPDLGSP